MIVLPLDWYVPIEKNLKYTDIDNSLLLSEHLLEFIHPIVCKPTPCKNRVLEIFQNVIVAQKSRPSVTMILKVNIQVIHSRDLESTILYFQ